MRHTKIETDRDRQIEKRKTVREIDRQRDRQSQTDKEREREIQTERDLRRLRRNGRRMKKRKKMSFQRLVTERRSDGATERRTDKVIYRDARTHLKREENLKYVGKMTEKKLKR